MNYVQIECIIGKIIYETSLEPNNDVKFFYDMSRYLSKHPEIGRININKSEGEPLIEFNDGYWKIQDSTDMKFYICKRV